MYTVSIGGMRLRHWYLYFGVLRKTFAALRAAKTSPGCVDAKIGQKANIFFALSVWETQSDMKRYASTGIHRDLMKVAHEYMRTTFNHSYECETVPTLKEAMVQWHKHDPSAQD